MELTVHKLPEFPGRVGADQQDYDTQRESILSRIGQGIYRGFRLQPGPGLSIKVGIGLET